MKEIFKMVICYFRGHKYKWHFSDSPISTTWYQCSRCGKIEWRDNLNA